MAERVRRPAARSRDQRDRGELRLDRRDRLQTLRLQVRGSATGGIVASQLRVDARAHDASDETLPWHASFSVGCATPWRPRRRADADPRPRYADTQHAVLDGRSTRFVLHEDG